MKNAKLIDILKSFTKEECKDLSIYIEHVKVKDNTSAQQLFSYLYKQYPEFPEKNIEKEKCFKKLFPTKKYDENKLSKIMSELTKLIEEYIITRQSKSNELSNKIQLLRFYNERNLEKHYKQIEKEIEKLLQEIPLSAITEMLAYQYEEIKLGYSLKHENRQANYNLIYNTIEKFSNAQKLRWKNISKTNQFPNINEVNNDNIYYNIHHKIDKLLTENDEKYLIEIIEYYKIVSKKIDTEEKREILFLLIEYCLRKANSGQLKYYTYMNNIFNIIDNENLFLNIYSIIELAAYKNYITIALKINKINEAEIFLEKYKENLEVNTKEEVYNFNKALILFDKKNYSAILDLLLYCKFTDIFYKLNQRRLIIKTYFELLNTDATYFNSISDAITAFKKHLITLKNIPEQYILLNKNFLKFTDTLLVKNKISKAEKENLLEKLKNTTHVSERNWIEEKINLQYNFIK
jgi:hypothetical protein